MAHRTAGFTLVELLGVLLILSILVTVLVVSLMDSQDVIDQRLTEARIGQIGGVLSQYEGDHGDYPRSSFTPEQGEPPDNLNIGAECLVLGLYSANWDGTGLEDDWLDNVDGDQTKKKLSPAFADRQLRELVDTWGNPIAYFHHRDYGRSDLYLTLDPTTGEEIESMAQARKNTETGRWYEPRGFQLISAGADGLFGTEDDVENFGSP